MSPLGIRRELKWSQNSKMFLRVTLVASQACVNWLAGRMANRFVSQRSIDLMPFSNFVVPAPTRLAHIHFSFYFCLCLGCSSGTAEFNHLCHGDGSVSSICHQLLELNMLCPFAMCAGYLPRWCILGRLCSWLKIADGTFSGCVGKNDYIRHQ